MSVVGIKRCEHDEAAAWLSRPAESFAKPCTRFTKRNKDPNPFTYQEYNALVTKGCLHPVDAASVTLAFYPGLRPGELCGLAQAA